MKLLYKFCCFAVLFSFVVCEPFKVYIHHASEIYSTADSLKVEILRLSGSGICKATLSKSSNFTIENSNDHVLPGKVGSSEFTIKFDNDTLNSQFSKISTDIFIECIDDDENKGVVQHQSSFTIIKKDEQQNIRFILYQYYESVLPKGKPFFLNFVVVQGRAVCELNIIHPFNGSIQNQIINFGDKSNYNLAFDIIAKATKDTKQDMKMFIELECKDSFNNFYSKDIILSILNSDASGYVPPNMIMEVPFVTASRKYYVSFESSSENCQFSLLGSAKANITGYNKYDFRIANQSRRIYFQVYVHDYSNSTSLSVQAKCVAGNSGKQRIYDAAILTTNQNTGVNGDPHFIQPVFDMNTFTLKSICYDFTGRSGNVINIIQLRKERISIYGELKDDYYMHKVFVAFPQGNITADVHRIKLMDGTVLKWANRHSEHLVNNLNFKMYNNLLTISHRVQVPRTKNNQIILKRSKNPITGQSLDVSIDRENYSYENFGGLLGRIGQNKYEFFGSVQKSEGVEDSLSSVRINGKLSLAKLENRGTNECWLLDINDLLQPQEILKFLK